MPMLPTVPTLPILRLNAAASTAIHPALAAAPRPASVLGVVDHAVYLELAPGSGRPAEVIAVLTSDAVRLPCALVLAVSSGERPLTRIGPGPLEPAVVGNGRVQWTGPAGVVAIHSVRRWTPPVLGPAAPGAMTGLGPLRQALGGIDIGIEPMHWAQPSVQALLGRGPGLTPSGDDLLAGLLLGARAFGRPMDELAALIDELAPGRTTALSARLLHHAGAGECVREVAALIAALPDPRRRDPAIAALLALGHTSGAALGRGLVIAAERALTPAG
jgi:Protein of unknown function (DUF2877)